MRMYKYYLAIITVLISITNTTFSTANPGLQPTVAAGSTIDAAASANTIGTTQTAEAQTNTISAKRQEFKDAIVKNSDTESAKSIGAVQELIKFENKEDIVWLIQHMAEKQKSNLNVKIKQEILAYPNQSFVTTALIKAGKALSPDVNLIAANMLLDKKEEAEAGIIMVALIKKGVMTKQVIEIRDRIIKQGKIEIMRMTNGIYSELCFLVDNEAVPEDVQAFALLMQASFINASFDSGRKEWVIAVLGEAKHVYLLNAVDLLGKVIKLSSGNQGVSLEILNTLITSQYKDVALNADAIYKHEQNIRKTMIRKIISGEIPQDINERIETIHYYLRDYGDDNDEVLFLSKVLKKEKNEKIIIELILRIETAKSIEKAIDTLIQLANSGLTALVRGKAIEALLLHEKEEIGFKCLWKLIDDFSSKNKSIGWDYFGGFKNEKIRNENKKRLLKLCEYPKKLPRSYAEICLLGNYNIVSKDFQKNILEIIATDKTELDDIEFIIGSLRALVVSSQKKHEINELIEKIRRINNPKAQLVIEK